MKKIFLVAVSLLMGHSLTSMNRNFVKKFTDNDDHHFQSLCPSLRSSTNFCSQYSKNHKTSLGLVDIDRDDNTFTDDYLLNVQSECTGSISKLRNFVNSIPEVL